MFTRPSLPEALEAWEKALAEHGHSADLLWLFEENLCFEKSRAGQGGFRFSFQTQFTPPPADALDIAFDHFSETDARLVFYRLGKCRNQSLCALLCDSWFDAKGGDHGFLHRDEWGVSFHPGFNDEIEEVTDLGRWLRRAKRGRAFHDLDFCMTLAVIKEIKTHGRVLMPYERFAEMLFNRLRRFLGQPA
jgi:hypothetical protein